MNVLASLTTPQILYIAIGSAIVAIAIFLGIYIPVAIKNKSLKFKEYFYKKVYQVAFNEDYYLINNFGFKVDEGKIAIVDHILFGEKFIYLISSLYYEGDLSGSYDDKSLVFRNNKGIRRYTDNPFGKSEWLLTRISGLTGIDQKLFVGIVMVNDECNLNVSSQSKQFYIVQRKKFALLVKTLENLNIGKINADQIDHAVKAMDKINKRKKKSS
ncbi:MAG: hypothetical protein HUJ59_02115 [Bacilli bacterium]|nr:hypothetical protein [Bacilli bacterium]